MKLSINKSSEHIEHNPSKIVIRADEKIISKALSNIQRRMGKDYEPTALELQMQINLIEYYYNKNTL
jgi:hypothetical protein